MIRRYAILILAVPALSAALSAGPLLLRPTITETAQVQVVVFPDETAWTLVPGPNKKYPIAANYYLKYSFSEKPRMGLVILKIQVFDQYNDQVVPFKATGRSGMPSMRGAHDSGEVEFKLNKKNDYLLPINVVMPGDWEIRVTFRLNDQAVFHGSIRFNV
ncbi:MAG: hypothetical protein NTW38_07050 [Candidatus Aminicenantes bacterium]|nr:hypothetical protein [Candidatus Aminicenantes bacterium]